MSKFWSICIFILVTELCERFAYYGLTGSLVIFLQRDLGFTNVLATELTGLFGAVVYVTPVLGAYLADAHWGRYSTILFFCVWYIVGLLMTTASAWPTVTSDPGAGGDLPTWVATALAMTGLFLGVGLGAGGIKSNVVVLGADQFELPREAAAQDSFFRYFYWSINIGATVAFTYLTNLAVNGQEPLVPKDYGFFASFALPTIAFILGITVFWCGRHRYTTKPPEGSVVSDFLRTVGAAAPHSGRGRALIGGVNLLLIAFCTIIASFFLSSGTHEAVAVAGMALIAIALLLLVAGGAKVGWLRDGTAAELAGVAAAEPPAGGAAAATAAAADVVRVLPIAATLVMFWCVYSQMSTNFVIQGCQMDLNVLGTTLSPATLNVFDSVVIMLLIPVVDGGVYPLLARLGMPMTMLGKIGVGFCFAAASMVAAGVVEIARIQAGPLPGNATSPCSEDGLPLPMSSLSIWWQTPQYMLIGLGEIFTAITSYTMDPPRRRRLTHAQPHTTAHPAPPSISYRYELFYSQVPANMRSVCQSVNLLCTSFGSLSASGLNSLLGAWITPNLNDGKLYLVFFTLGGLMLANAAAFAGLACSFEYSAAPPAADEPDDVRRSLLRESASGPLAYLQSGVSASSSLRHSGMWRSRSKSTLDGDGDRHDPLLADEQRRTVP